MQQFKSDHSQKAKQNVSVANVGSEISGKRQVQHGITRSLTGETYFTNNSLQSGKSTIQKKLGNNEELPLQGMLMSKAQNNILQAFSHVQNNNNIGIPDNLKKGLESMSGFDMNDVKVHYNSPKPAQLQAFAYAQGNNIHIGPGQEKHLPHEAWHIVQQKQGRIQPTVLMKGGLAVNDDPGLEREADVMGEKAAQKSDFTTSALTAFNPSASVSQLKCAHCKLEDKLVQKKEEPLLKKNKTKYQKEQNISGEYVDEYLPGIYSIRGFDIASAELKPDILAELDHIAKEYRKKIGIGSKILITGFASPSVHPGMGPERYAMARAESIKKYLSKQVHPDSIVIDIATEPGLDPLAVSREQKTNMRAATIEIIPGKKTRPTDSSGLNNKVDEMVTREKSEIKDNAIPNAPCLKSVKKQMEHYSAEFRQWYFEQNDKKPVPNKIWDAFGHCFMGCLGTQRCGLENAKTGSERYERVYREWLGGGPHDSLTQDTNNEAIGRNLGMTGEDCYNSCLDQINSDKLDLSAPPNTLWTPNAPTKDGTYRDPLYTITQIFNQLYVSSDDIDKMEAIYKYSNDEQKESLSKLILSHISRLRGSDQIRIKIFLSK